MVGEAARNHRKLACRAMRRRKSEAIGTGLENANDNPQMHRKIWRDDRVVEGTGLENRRAVKRTQGSNPCLSAIEIPRLFGRGISIMYKNERGHPCAPYTKNRGHSTTVLIYDAKIRR